MLQRFESLTADGVGGDIFGHFMCSSISIYGSFKPSSKKPAPCVVNIASVYILDYLPLRLKHVQQENSQ